MMLLVAGALMGKIDLKYIPAFYIPPWLEYASAWNAVD